MSYETLKKQINKMPSTYGIGILACILKFCRKNVFKDDKAFKDGVKSMIQQIIKEG